jgi:16S rRNA (guanine966-N2)-methyltransferase
MRVIAGSAKGRRLKGPGNRSGATRPTSDLMRGAIFDSLAALGADLSLVLDVYAGSGALGIEALSRGAEHCEFVERERAACAVIQENLRLTGFEDRARVHCMPVAGAVTRLQGPYTLILADPPYNDEQAVQSLAAFASAGILAEDAVLVLEHGAQNEPPGELGGLSLVRVRRHGDSAAAIYARR